MTDIKFKLAGPEDKENIELIAKWYLSEWKIPEEKTVSNIGSLASGDSQFQVLMTIDDVPVATGGIYNHTGLIDKEPRFGIFKHWLALVYTIPEKRQQGLGAMLCEYIQEHAKKTGISEIHLFTDTAESLYERLGWVVVERLTIAGRNIAIMKKEPA